MKIDIYKDFQRYLFTNDLSESTVDSYVRIARIIENYLSENFDVNYREKLDSIKGYMISHWASSIMDKKVATRALYITIANCFFRFLYNMQYIAFDLASALPPVPNIEKHHKIHPEEYQPKQGYTQQEIERMMSIPDPKTFNGARNIAIMAMLIGTGLRVSELASLNVGDPFDKSGFMMVARKGTHGNKVKVAMPEGVQAFLSPYLSIRKTRNFSCEPGDPLFISNRGKRMDRSRIYEAVSEIQKKAGCHTGVHTYRHTALTHIAKHADPVVSRDVAGQKSISITNRYLHSTDEEMLQAVNSLSDLLPIK